MTIGDAREHSRVLYFGSSLSAEGDVVANFSLPPLPPPGAFDARLAGDTRLVELNEAVVYTQTSDYPLLLELGGRAAPGVEYEIEVYVDDVSVAVYALSPTGSVTIEERGVGRLYVRARTEALPRVFTLTGVYPNPVVDEVTVAFDLPEPAHVKLELYDVLGRRVHSIDEPEAGAGAGHLLRLRSTSFAAGVYLFRLVVDMPSQTHVETGRITVVK